MRDFLGEPILIFVKYDIHHFENDKYRIYLEILTNQEDYDYKHSIRENAYQ